MIAESIRLGLTVLNEYIKEMEYFLAYWLAMLLHPEYRTIYLDLSCGTAKREEVLSAMKKVYRDQYSQLPVTKAPLGRPRPINPRTAFLFGDDYLPTVLGDYAGDKVDLYLSETPHEVKDPIQW